MKTICYHHSRARKLNLWKKPKITLCELGAVFAPLGNVSYKPALGPSISNKQSAKAACEKYKMFVALTPKNFSLLSTRQCEDVNQLRGGRLWIV